MLKYFILKIEKGIVYIFYLCFKYLLFFYKSQ